MHVPSLVKIPWHLLKVSFGNKIWVCLGQITPSKFDKICPLAIPNQISIILMHIPSLMKIHWCLIKLSSGNKNMGVSRADNSIKIWRNLPISNLKPDLYNINAHTKFGENPLMFTNVIIRKQNTNGCRLTGLWTDRHTDVQRETTTPSHYHVVGYNDHLWSLFYSLFGKSMVVQLTQFSFWFQK